MKHAHTLFRAVALASVLVLAGCAPATTGGSSQGSNILTREELVATEATNLYDAIQRLRPRWLAVRGTRSFGDAGLSTDIVVYQGQTLLGGVDALRQFGTATAARVRFLDGATASASLPGLGSRHVEGAIVIETSQ